MASLRVTTVGKSRKKRKKYCMVDGWDSSHAYAPGLILTYFCPVSVTYLGVVSGSTERKDDAAADDVVEIGGVVPMSKDSLFISSSIHGFDVNLISSGRPSLDPVATGVKLISSAAAEEIDDGGGAVRSTVMKSWHCTL